VWDAATWNKAIGAFPVRFETTSAIDVAKKSFGVRANIPGFVPDFWKAMRERRKDAEP
jgi:hypothetical protein